MNELPNAGSMCCRRDQPSHGRAVRGGMVVTAAERCISACNVAKILHRHVSENALIRQRNVVQAHLSMSLALAGTLQPAAVASAESREASAISHETASLSLAVATFGTTFTAFNSFITRSFKSLSRFLSMTMQHGEVHPSGTVRHTRWRMRSMSSARVAAYGQQLSLHTTSAKCSRATVGVIFTHAAWWLSETA